MDAKTRALKRTRPRNMVNPAFTLCLRNHCSFQLSAVLKHHRVRTQPVILQSVYITMKTFRALTPDFVRFMEMRTAWPLQKIILARESNKKGASTTSRLKMRTQTYADLIKGATV